MNTSSQQPKYVLYGWSACKYCRKAETALEVAGQSFEKIDVDLSWASRKEFFDHIKPSIGDYPSKVPLIFSLDEESNEKRFIGGYSQLVKLLSKLDIDDLGDDF